MPSVQTFTCQACRVTWTRPTCRGHRPAFCPPCRAKHYVSGKCCQTCGIHTPHGHRYCSHLCYQIKRGRDRCPVPVRHPSRIEVKVRPRSTRVYLPDCVICGRCFATPYTTKTCSPTCRKQKHQAACRESKHRRRARKRGAFVANVSRLTIYKRDSWTCQVCHRAVHRNRVAPHPYAPTLDHIIPLAVGGTHEPVNVQLAHFICNARKAHTGGGDQLLLIG